MRTLQDLAAELLDQPLCETPPVEQVAARARLLRRRRRLATVIIVTLVGGRISSWRR